MPWISIQDRFTLDRRKEVLMFIFNDIIDLFALYGIVRLGRVLYNRRNKLNR